MAKKYIVDLTNDERAELKQLLKGGRVRIQLVRDNGNRNRSTGSTEARISSQTAYATSSDQEEQEECDRWQQNPNNPWEYYCVVELPPVINEPPPPPPPIWIIEGPPPDEPIPPPPSEEDGAGNPPTPPDPDFSLTANLTCTPTNAERGTTVRCEIQFNRESATVDGWQFQGSDGESARGASSHDWALQIVKPGRILVSGRDGNQAISRTANISVTPRSWPWNQSRWSLSHQTGPDCYNEHVSGMRVYGWAFTSKCNILYVEPSLEEGYTLKSVAGYDHALWYVESSMFKIDITTQIEREFRADGDKRDILLPSQAADCTYRPGQPVSTVLSINMKMFNERCAPVSQFTNFVDTLWKHEKLHMDLGLGQRRWRRKT